MPGGLAIGYLLRRLLVLQCVLIHFLALFFFSCEGRTVAMEKITRKRSCHESVKVGKSLIACRLAMGDKSVSREVGVVLS